jgi:hypothetical protein
MMVWHSVAFLITALAGSSASSTSEEADSLLLLQAKQSLNTDSVEAGCSSNEQTAEVAHLMLKLQATHESLEEFSLKTAKLLADPPPRSTGPKLRWLMYALSAGMDVVKAAMELAAVDVEEKKPLSAAASLAHNGTTSCSGTMAKQLVKLTKELTKFLPCMMGEDDNDNLTPADCGDKVENLSGRNIENVAECINTDMNKCKARQKSIETGNLIVSNLQSMIDTFTTFREFQASREV